MRLPPNIVSGGWVWPRRDGRRERLPARHVLAALKAGLLRQASPA